MKKTIIAVGTFIIFFSLVLSFGVKVDAAKYKSGGTYKSAKIGKSKYKIKSYGSKYKIVRIKKGKTKVLVKNITGTTLLTNGKYIYYVKGKYANKLYRYKIKTGNSRYFMKVKKSKYEGEEGLYLLGAKSKYIYYSQELPEATHHIAVFNKKTHSKKTLKYASKNGRSWVSFTAIKGKRIYCEDYVGDVDGVKHLYIYNLNGKFLNKVTMGHGPCWREVKNYIKRH